MKKRFAILIVAFAGFVSQHFAESSGSGKCAARRASEPPSTVATRLPAENQYDTDLSITHLDISLKTDFQSNNVNTVVRASVENWSKNPVNKADFWLCPGMNDRDFGAEVRHVYRLDCNKKKNLKYTMRTTEDIYSKGNPWEIYEVLFERPILPGKKLDLEFAYTMKGKPDHSSTPIWRSNDGLKELYLRGEDWAWCPALYVKQKKRVYPNLYKPSWALRMEYPVGYVAVADGELVEREQREGIVKEEWKSSANGTPCVFISKYKVERRSEEGVTLEVYAPDEELLKKAADKFDDYARIFKLYVTLYGDPGSSIYRIVGSPVQSSGGMGKVLAQIIPMHSMGDVSLVAHEMAHTWWGNLVSSYGEGTKFLREAMAEFSNKYARTQLGDENFVSDNWVLLEKRRYFCHDFAISDTWNWPPLIQQEGYNPNAVTVQNYHRGPLVLNQLRLILGDRVFFQCLKAFATKYNNKTVNIYDFIDTINKVSGRDMTSELRGLLWSTGYPSYRLAGFESEKEDGSYRTKVRIQNEGEYGLTCPLLLKMRGGEKRAAFKIKGKDEREFVFTTEHEVTDVVIDPDLTAFQYHPDQKMRLWRALRPAGLLNWVWYGKSYMYYSIGEHEKAIDTITEYFSTFMEQQAAKGIEEIIEAFKLNAAYLFMRGVFHLALDDREHAEEDIKMAFPYMLDALYQGESVGPPGAYYRVGAVKEKDLDQYLALLSQTAGREFSFATGLDDEAKKRKVEEWKQWWEKEGKQKKLDLDALKERCEAQRRALRERGVSLMESNERTGG